MNAALDLHGDRPGQNARPAMIADAAAIENGVIACRDRATLVRPTVEKCAVGVTRVPARAPGMNDRVVMREAGTAGDLAIGDIGRPAQRVDHLGASAFRQPNWSGQ